KRAEKWRDAIGQLLSYAVDKPTHEKILILFGYIDIIDHIKNTCKSSQINIIQFEDLINRKPIPIVLKDIVIEVIKNIITEIPFDIFNFESSMPNFKALVEVITDKIGIIPRGMFPLEIIGSNKYKSRYDYLGKE